MFVMIVRTRTVIGKVWPSSQRILSKGSTIETGRGLDIGRHVGDMEGRRCVPGWRKESSVDSVTLEGLGNGWSKLTVLARNQVSKHDRKSSTLLEATGEKLEQSTGA